MAKKENSRPPRPAVQRPTSPTAAASSDLEDGRASYNHASPPRTPPSQIDRAARGKGAAARAPRNRPALREDTFDSHARDVDTDHTHIRNRSSSHDLSWPPRNDRASIVDNMLASLDSFPEPPPNPPRSSAAAAHSTFSTTTTTTTNNTTTKQSNNAASTSTSSHRFASQLPVRSRAHTVSSSTSSDFSFHGDDYSPPSKTFHGDDHSPPCKSRGHRSNSSTNFKSSLGRIDSVRLNDEREQTVSRGRAPGSNPTAHGHGRQKNGKGSASSSLDFGPAAARRWQRSMDRRSSSFDHDYNRPAFAAPEAVSASSPLTLGQQEALFYDGLDAAPMPTISLTSRRNASPAGSTNVRPDSSLSGAQAPQFRRRGSMRSPMSFFNRSERNDEALEPEEFEERARSEAHTRTGSSGLAAPMGSTRSSGRPDPHQTPTSVSMGKERERPGFFKRVFGSSSKYPPSSYNPPFEPKPSASSSFSKQSGRIDGPSASPATQKLSKAPPPQAPPPPTRPPTGEKPQSKELPQTPALNKKSSFFRRRKKSISEPTRVPQLPAMPDPAPARLDVEQEPEGALRQAMDPYLHSPRRSNKTGGEHFRRLNGQDVPWPVQGAATFPQSTLRSVHRHNESEVIVLPSASKPPSSFNNDEDHDAPVTPCARAADSAVDPPGGSSVPRIPQAKSQPPGSDRQPPPPPPPPPKASGSAADGKIFSPIPLPMGATRSAVIKKSANDSARTSPRLWIRPEQDADASKDRNPSVGNAGEDAMASASTLGEYKSASSKQHSPVTEGPTYYAKQPLHTFSTREEPAAAAAATKPVPPAELWPDGAEEPTEEDRRQAGNLFHGDSEIPASNAAAWLGEAGPGRARVRRAYMELFDWENMNILATLRSFCSQLKLKGESQQVDRLLDSLSSWWCVCNPNNGFKATDVVHTICYSLLLLNTDLHMADIEQKMTRTQFIKNTVPTVRRVVQDAAPDAFATARGSMLPPPRPDTTQDESGNLDPPTTYEGRRPTDRLAARPSDHSGKELTVATSQLEHDNGDDCGPLVKAPFTGRASAWEAQVEIVLRIFYNSIRQERLPLFGGGEDRKAAETNPSSNSLSAVAGGVLRRTNSLLSKAGSESLPARGRPNDSRMGSRWSSKTRSRPRLYQASLAQSSRTSFDDDQSLNSPSASSMWSKYSLGKTQTSMSQMSVKSAASDFPRGDYKQSIGFANALSQAIIREEAAGDPQEETMRIGPLLEDESLELAGAPWAKEGILKHKHHLESVDKKSRDRNWTECFAVIDKGWMSMFQFNVNAKSMRQKARNQRVAGGVVGGGNWTENAEPIGKYLLRQSIASALPPPGYSKSRPHVWALSLPNGAVHLFQAGTPEIVKEFVSSANYWSARMSKEPLVGGVSNVEYGWSDNVINTALIIDRSGPTLQLGAPRPSIQSSIRSSIDQGSGRPKLPGDRITMSDWSPPAQSMMASQLLEVDQLRALSNYVKNIELELKRHNELRAPMTIIFTPRLPNSIKAMNNWERKSSYLLREIVKFSTYIDSLQQAQALKGKVYREREERELERERSHNTEESSGIYAGEEQAAEGEIGARGLFTTT